MDSKMKRRTNWKYILVYVLLILVNVLPLITEKPYQSQDTQDVIINLLMVSTKPYKPYGLVFHIATIFIIAAAQTVGQTQKYGFVIHTGALLTAFLLGITWLVVAIRNDIHPTFKKPTLLEYGLIPLALLAFWGPYAATDGTIHPDFNLLLLLTSPDYGLTFCFTTPVFLLGLTFFYPNVNQFAYRITAFSGMLYGLFNLTHWFNPDTRWMGFLHLPLLIISIYALILPGLKSQPLQIEHQDAT